MIKIDNENENENKYSFIKVDIVYIVLFSIIIAISSGIGIYFVCYHWYLKKYGAHSIFDTRAETIIYWTFKWEKPKN